MRKKILLLLLSVSCIYSACTDEDLLVPRGVKQPEYVDDSPLVKVAKAYVDGTEGRFSLPDAAVTFSRELTRSSHEPAFTVNNGEVTLEWKKAESYDDGDSEVLTVPIKTKNKMTVYRNITKNNKREKGHTPMYSRLIVRKFKDTDYSYSFVASYVPDRAYMKGNKVKHDKYVNRPEGTHYSGLYIVSELNGRMLYGIKYKEGKEEFRFRPNLEKDFYQKMLQQNPNDTIIQGRLKQMKHTSNHLMLKFIGTQALTRASNTGNSNSEYEEVACSTCGGDANECDCYIIYEQYVNNYNGDYNNNYYNNESVYEDHCGNNNRDYVYNNTPTTPINTIPSQKGVNGSSSNHTPSINTTLLTKTEVCTIEHFFLMLPQMLVILKEKYGVTIKESDIRFGTGRIANANVIPYTSVIQIFQSLSSHTYIDCLSVLYHEFCHIKDDLFVFLTENIVLDKPIAICLYEELTQEFQEYLGRTYPDEIYSLSDWYKKEKIKMIEEDLSVKKIHNPNFYLNEINAYNKELKMFPDVSYDYDVERRFNKFKNEKLYELSKKYFNKTYEY